MAIEKNFYFRPAARDRSGKEARLLYRIVQETRTGKFAPPVKVTLSGIFTQDEKITLEALSRRVNEERLKKGIL